MARKIIIKYTKVTHTECEVEVPIGVGMSRADVAVLALKEAREDAGPDAEAWSVSFRYAADRG